MDQTALNEKLIDAAKEDELEVVKYCIENGANKEYKDVFGMTPLLLAVGYGNLEILQYLIEKGSDKDTRDVKKNTPLLLAVKTSNYDMTEFLVTRGFDKESRNKNGWTPFLMAVRQGDLKIAKLLHSKGSDVKTKYLVGKTACHLAVEGNNPHVLKWLIENRLCNPLEITYQGNTSFDLVTEEDSDGDEEDGKRKKKEVIDYLKNIDYRIGQDVIQELPQLELTTPILKSDRNMSSFIFEEENGAKCVAHIVEGSDKVIPRKWMLFFTTIDSELPSKFRWIKENGEQFEKMENDYLNLLKDLPTARYDPQESGIYQCVRTLETGREDRINVVLHVTESSQIVSMIVHPEYWEKDMFDQPPAIIKQHLSNVHRTNHRDRIIDDDDAVKWEHRAMRSKKYTTLNKNLRNPLHMDRKYRGEYKCTVRLQDETQIYFFVLQSPSQPGETSQKTADTPNQITNRSKAIIGVPSVLEPKEKFLYFAYGSNLLKQRLKLNNPSAQYYTNAKLKHYKLDFIAVKDPKTSKWNGGVANITQSGGDYVCGTVWKLDVEDIPSLNKQEGFYKPVDVVVMSGEVGPLKCRTYLVESSIARSDEWGHKPSYLYKAVIINGAVESKLDQDYIKKLLEIEVNDYSGPTATAVTADATAQTERC